MYSCGKECVWRGEVLFSMHYRVFDMCKRYFAIGGCSSTLRVSGRVQLCASYMHTSGSGTNRDLSAHSAHVYELISYIAEAQDHILDQGRHSPHVREFGYLYYLR